MFVITSTIEHQGKDIDVYYVGHGTGKDTIWSDHIDESKTFASVELAEDTAENLIEVTTIRTR